MKHYIALTAAVVMLGACSWSWSPFSGPQEQSRIPSDATIYQCENGRTLAVRYMGGGTSAMIIFPEREFRLDRTDEGRYTNGVSVLGDSAGEVWLEERGQRTYGGCKSQAS